MKSELEQFNKQNCLLEQTDHHYSQTYTCSHCQMNFNQEKCYKLHYKSELHKYNLKRKMLNLSPISEQQFLLQVKPLQSEPSDHSNILSCLPCGKSFSTPNTLNNHLKSKKHRQKMTQNTLNTKEKQYCPDYKDTESDTSISKNYEKCYYNTQVCLFCDLDSQNLKKNIDHMQKTHGFFIIQEQFVSNIKGIIQYLGLQINNEYICISCGTQFKSTQGVKKHMIDKQHCFMPPLSMKNSHFLAFYNFSQPKPITKKYQDEQVEDIQIIDLDLDLEGSELEYENNMICEEELEKKKEEFQIFMSQIRKGVNITNEGEIKIFNGKIIGHRQYKQYYKLYYRDMEQFNQKIQKKMMGTSQNNFKLKQKMLKISDDSNQNEQQLALLKKEYIKKQDKGQQKSAQKYKYKFGNSIMNARSYQVSGKKCECHM